MPANVNPPRAECPKCARCSSHEHLQQVNIAEGGRHLNDLAGPIADRSTAGNGPLRGARFALASLGLFLVPVLLAMIGASLSASLDASDQNRQILGAAVGLFVGMLGVMVVARVLRSRSLELPKGEAL